MPKEDNLSANFSQLYRDTCVGMRPSGSLGPYTPVYIKNVQMTDSPSLSHFQVNCVSHDPVLLKLDNPDAGLRTIVHYYDDCDWNVSLPKMGLVNFSNSLFAYVLSKQVAQKQYSRGFGYQYLRAHPSINYSAFKTYSELGPTVKIIPDRLFELFTAGVGPGRMLHMYMESINRKWYDPKTAINMVRGDHISVALSLNWQVVAARQNDRCAELYHGMFPVGYFSDEGTVFVKSFYEQEFIDLLTRNGYKLNVQTYQ